MKKTSAMTQVLDGLQATIAARKLQLGKIASDSLSTTQGTSESSAPSPSSDPIVGEILPHGNSVPAAPKDNLISSQGVEVGQSLPNQANPTEEEMKRQETSPETKLGAATDFAALRNRLSGVVKVAADKVALYIEQKKAGDGTPAPGSDDPASIPPIPTGGKDLSLGGGAKADTSTTVPKIDGVQGVSQATVSPGKSDTDLQQGTQEQKVGGVIDLDALAAKVAMVSHHYGIGQAIGYQIQSMVNGGDNTKTAGANPAPINEATIHKIAADGANDILSFGVANGIITLDQAQSIQKKAGIAPHPVDVAIHNYQTKVAALMAKHQMSPDKTAAFIRKVAMNEDPAAVMGGDPAAAQSAGADVQPELQQVVAEIAAAVESGQMSEEQALAMMQQLGIPVEQILAQQGGGAPMGDPAAGAGAVPPMSDPAAAAEITGAMAGGAPAGPADPAAASGGAPAPAGPPAGAPPAAPEGGEKKPEEKPEGGEKKSEGEKKPEGGEKKEEGGEKKDDDKKDDSKKEGAAKKANDPMAAPVPADPAAGGAPVDPMAAGGDPAAGAAGGDPQQLLEQIIQDLQAAVAAGMMTEEQAQAVLSDLAGGGAPAGDPAAGGAAPAADPAAMGADPAAAAGAPPVPVA